MFPSSLDPADRDRRLEEVLAAYLRAVERDERPDRAALLARHPELADELAAFFANRDALERRAAPWRPRPAEGESTLAEGGSGVAAPGTKVRCFGDYELLAEI